MRKLKFGNRGGRGWEQGRRWRILNGSLTRKRATGTEGGLRRTKEEYQARGERTEEGYGNSGRAVGGLPRREEEECRNREGGVVVVGEGLRRNTRREGKKGKCTRENGQGIITKQRRHPCKKKRKTSDILWGKNSQTIEEFTFVVINKFTTGERKKGTGES